MNTMDSNFTEKKLHNLYMDFPSQFLHGTFLAEGKTRFLCSVLMDGVKHECYVPSSAKLSKYMKLDSKPVLLTLNKGTKNRTEYSLFAVQHKNQYVILNLRVANILVGQMLLTKRAFRVRPLAIKKEVYINGYKTDFLLDTPVPTIVEVKSVLSLQKECCFPDKNSNRTFQQLEQLEFLLKQGLNAQYYFVSLSPFVRTIVLEAAFSTLLRRLTHEGLQVFSYRAVFSENDVKLKPIQLSFN